MKCSNCGEEKHTRFARDVQTYRCNPCERTEAVSGVAVSGDWGNGGT